MSIFILIKQTGFGISGLLNVFWISAAYIPNNQDGNIRRQAF
jgi:hypothetical protein